MPIKDSAKKYMRVTAKNTQRNRIVRGQYRNEIKKLETALAEDNIKEAQTILVSCQKALDKAVQKNVIKKNTAARKKSRLNKKVKAAADAKK